MQITDNLYGAAKEVVIDFLSKTPPFKELQASELEELAVWCVAGFFPRGALILEEGVTEIRNLYIIQRGGVRLYLRGEGQEETLMDYQGEGSQFGALNLLSDSKADYNVQTLEDTFCFLLEKHAFLEMIEKHPSIAGHYIKNLSRNLFGPVYSELRSRKLESKTEQSFQLFSAKVGDVVKRSPETILTSESVHTAALTMSRLDIGSLLVREPSGNIVGIVTDKDLRRKVVAARTDIDDQVADIMVSPVTTVSVSAPCFDAVLQMMNHRVHHLAVEQENNIIGVITAHDILVFQGSSPLFLLREIDAQKEISGLYGLSSKIPTVIRSLIEEGGRANNITRMIAVINDHIIEKLLSLLQAKMGNPPVPFAWIVMGSEGRREQTFRTDQDNAIVYENPSDDWEQVKAAKLYFRFFGNEAIEHITACGYPLCKGGMMASRSRWRKPYSVWTGYFDQWMSSSDEFEILNAKIFFDFRTAFGDKSLGRRLRDHISEEALKKTTFLDQLAKDCVALLPPLSFFRNFIVEKDGEHKHHLDLKFRGLVPFVDFARMAALRFGVKETNTTNRLKVLSDQGGIPHELYSETVEAYEFVMQLRLVHQLRQMEAGLEPSNYVDPADLSDLEKATLKEAFGVVNRIQHFTAKMRSKDLR